MVDESDKLIGIVTRTDVKDALIRGETNSTVEKIMSRDTISVIPGETLGSVINKMRKHKLSRLPVVDTNDKTSLIGIITKGDILKAYQSYQENR